jgi:hypothetical protein
MLPDDLPDNVVPLRPRQSTRRTAAAAAPNSNATTNAASSTTMPGAADPVSAVNPMPIAGIVDPAMSYTAVSPFTGSAGPATADTATTSPQSATATAPAAPIKRWQFILILLAGAFLLGMAIAWGAIAIGANIVGFWPHGFAFYAMLVGGGATMMLTAGLMGALFYSDSSGHDAAVHQFQPDQRRRPPRQG